MFNTLPHTAGADLSSAHFRDLTTPGADAKGQGRALQPSFRAEKRHDCLSKGQALPTNADHGAILAAGAEVGNVRVRDGAGRDVVHDIPFAFAFHAVFPDGQWMLGD